MLCVAVPLYSILLPAFVKVPFLTIGFEAVSFKVLFPMSNVAPGFMTTLRPDDPPFKLTMAPFSKVAQQLRHAAGTCRMNTALDFYISVSGDGSVVYNISEYKKRIAG